MIYPFKKFTVTAKDANGTIVLEHTCWALNNVNAVIKASNRMSNPVGYTFTWERLK